MTHTKSLEHCRLGQSSIALLPLPLPLARVRGRGITDLLNHLVIRASCSIDCFFQPVQPAHLRLELFERSDMRL